MKKLILIALVALGAWMHFNKTPLPVVAEEEDYERPVAEPRPAPARQSISSSFRCDGRQYCSQMTSRAEAVFFINNCPNTKMDGDNDGIPCESDSRF